jgi:hypothetical protein
MIFSWVFNHYYCFGSNLSGWIKFSPSIQQIRCTHTLGKCISETPGSKTKIGTTPGCMFGISSEQEVGLPGCGSVCWIWQTLLQQDQTKQAIWELKGTRNW